MTIEITHTGSQVSILGPYLPRLVIDWIADDADQSYQEIEGSVTFVDVSGFTNLSERLAKRGKIGAEDLADSIGSCFTDLLAVAYGEGGGLLKFGGDALLLLFTGPGHEARACRAAVAMRQELRTAGRLEVSGARVQLRMSAGVHTGLFHLFLVGEAHKEFIITGPAASRTVAMEGAAAAGEIVVGDTTAGALRAADLGATKGPGRLLRRAPRWTVGSTPTGAPVVPPSDLDLSRCIPVALRDSLMADLREPEHRLVTVAFVHYSGTDAMLEQLGAGRVAAALEQLIVVVQRAADRQNVAFLGTDIDADGGKIILTAGAPTTSGDDERRMLLTLREIADADLDLPVQLGVNRGAVFAGDIGPLYRRTYTVMGDTVNLAARLMARAGHGEIIASTDVLERSPTRFECETLEPFMVKGKARPVDAVRVGSVIGSSALGTASGLPFLGRDPELDTLVRAGESAAGGEGQYVEIVGEAGIGKSRLVDEMRDRLGGMTHLCATSEMYESATPYFTFRGLACELLGIAPGTPNEIAVDRIRDALGVVAPELLPWAPLVAVVADVPMPDTRETAELEGRFRGAKLGETVSELLARALPGPTLLLIEEAHWMDDASADLLRRLLTDLPGRPWFVCVTRRAHDRGFLAPEGVGTTIELAPLDPEVTTELFHLATVDAPIPAHELRALVARSGGHPLFLRELVAAAGSGNRGEALPDSVEALIAARIDRLDPRDRNVLRRASVLGQAFSVDLLDAVVEPPLGSDDPAWARLRDFIAREHDGHVRFENALVRDSAYEGLSFRLRRELHAKVADVIAAAAGDDRDTHAELLSLHYLHAERYHEAWTHARGAADAAAAIWASVEAAALYQRALEAGRRVRDIDRSELARMYEALGDMRYRLGSYGAAEESYRAVRRLSSQDPVAKARSLLKVARVQGWQDRYSQARRSITRGLRLLDDENGEPAALQRARLLAWYARFCFAGDSRETIKWCRLAIEAAEAAGEKEALADALQVLDWAYEKSGRLDLAINVPRALELYEEISDLPSQASVYNSLGLSAQERGDLPGAIRYLERALEVTRRTGDAVMIGVCSNNIGEIALDQGHIDEAGALFRDALRAFRPSGLRIGIAFAKRNLGRVACWTGRGDDAQVLLRESLEETRAVGAKADGLETQARIAEAALVLGDAPAALALAEETLEGARALGMDAAFSPLLHRVRGAALARAGDLDAAAEALAQSVDAARARHADYEVALGLHAQARLAEARDYVAPAALVDESKEIFERAGVVAFPDLLGAELVSTSSAIRRPAGA
ncbi:MAG TPA: adenylate/guanylate cyclase domain-containing protein [Acidimicrobiia bacterium]|nr:adenylate/guanylate cyclase domain-containing protein [Acidimicrobiia bacterium]